jgi:hypothetical protein
MTNPNKYLVDTTRRWTSLLDLYRKENKITEDFEIILNNLSLEDIIALKLDLSCRTQKSPVYGIPIWKNLNKIVKDAVLKFAVSTTYQPSEAARLLGLRIADLKKVMKDYRLWQYFNRKKKPL